MTDFLKPYWFEIKIFAATILLTLAFMSGHHVAKQAGDLALAKQAANTASEAAKRAQDVVAFSEAARATEQKQAASFAAAEAKHQRDMTNAQANYDRNLADLRAGNLRMRAAWRCPGASGAAVSQAAAAAGGPDAGADEREQSASRIVRAADQCDAQVLGLQALLRAERE